MKKENIENVSRLNSEIIDLTAERNKLIAFKGSKFKLKLTSLSIGDYEFELNIDLLLDVNIKFLQEEIDSLEETLDDLLKEK